ncbi:MAG: hypothetical protein ACYDIC_17615 [Desulfobaccales bacterium]
MEYFQISQTNTVFHVEGFPNAAKLIRISGPNSKRLADLFLHKSDLDFAQKCLEAINYVPDEPMAMRQGLWRSAIVHFLKCFGNSRARSQLSSKKVYKGDIQGLEIFAYFESLRNKHVIHDENSYAQCIPGAVLNKREHPYKIEKIVCLSQIVETLMQENYSNLHLLIQKAKVWAVSEFDKLCEILTKELEAESYDDLYSREGITYIVPTVNDIHKKKNIP